MKPDHTLGLPQVNRFLENLFDGDLHAKRVLSLANATLGVIGTASLAVNTIGQGLALARGLATKHAIKYVDRLLSNEAIDIDAAALFERRYWRTVPGTRGATFLPGFTAAYPTSLDCDSRAL